MPGKALDQKKQKLFGTNVYTEKAAVWFSGTWSHCNISHSSNWN